MSKYQELLNKPPKLNINPGAKEIVFKLISCMCDNKYIWTMKKDESGQFKISTHRFAFSNFQTNVDKYEIEWEADNNNWEEVFKMINSGTSQIESLRSR